MMRKKIALLTGGSTGEWVISVKSAETIERNLDPEEYNVYKIMLTRDAWYHEAVDAKRYPVDKNDFSVDIKGEKITFDGVFIAIHGSPGEDGKLQGYFDMLDIPYTTCDALTSAITMNKGYTKAIVEGIDNLHTAKSLQIFREQSYSVESIKQQLKLPYFVKPNNGGSSIGMTKVTKAEDLEAAIERAFNEDSQILIEEFIEGREFTIGVVKLDGKITPLPATEVKTAKEFFDFEAKYTPGVAEEITPADIPADVLARVQQVVTDVYLKLNCKGIVRIDFILNGGTGDFYFIEINTIPGQTATSFIPQQVAAMGMELKNFYTKLIQETIG